jgi:hypothetical protein
MGRNLGVKVNSCFVAVETELGCYDWGHFCGGMKPLDLPGPYAAVKIRKQMKSEHSPEQKVCKGSAPRAGGVSGCNMKMWAMRGRWPGALQTQVSNNLQIRLDSEDLPPSGAQVYV